ncbi:hypothetical protein SAMN05720764_101504 [Fibrobacter sp. UWH5]|nr:hypothetical protein [Fibrobacter sp. UWH5]SHK47015.1 hypothetical protein SAMN05720764_101504 [Fibrobacter sp. UWH5]
MGIYERENCYGVIVQFGGQTPLNLAMRLKKAGANVVGTSPEDIDLAEDRDFFKQLVDKVGIKQAASGIAHNVEEALAIVEGLMDKHDYGRFEVCSLQEYHRHIVK